MACTEVKGTKTIRLFDLTEEEPQRILLSPGASITDLTTAVSRVETATQSQGAAVRVEPDLIDFQDEERSVVGESVNEDSSACEFVTHTAESFGYGHGCMMTVANPLAYIPVGESQGCRWYSSHIRKGLQKVQFRYPWGKTGRERKFPFRK